MRVERGSIRIVVAVVVSLAAPPVLAAQACESLDPCAARSCRLDAQIARAKDRGDAREMAALERQRADMVHCSDDGLRAKRKMALEQAQARVERREAELRTAEASGDARKIRKAQGNLESARKSYASIEKSPL